MSSKIILFPVGSNLARKHYANSIKTTTKVENLSEYLDLDGLNSIYYGENCEVALWGLGSTKRLYNIYCRIEKNDIVMFDKRWTSIAMGNAYPALKELADYVTDSNVNDGIYKACVHFGWITEDNQ